MRLRVESYLDFDEVDISEQELKDALENDWYNWKRCCSMKYSCCASRGMD
jgi:hypothetical protein